MKVQLPTRVSEVIDKIPSDVEGKGISRTVYLLDDYVLKVTMNHSGDNSNEYEAEWADMYPELVPASQVLIADVPQLAPWSVMAQERVDKLARAVWMESQIRYWADLDMLKTAATWQAKSAADRELCLDDIHPGNWGYKGRHIYLIDVGCCSPDMNYCEGSHSPKDEWGFQKALQEVRG